MENPTKYGIKSICMFNKGKGQKFGRQTNYRSNTGVCYICDQSGHISKFCPNRQWMDRNQQAAELMWNGPSDLVGPYNLKTLFQNF
ncbi:unnamed protein product [Brassica napus]|uniref:(rape) hypothetical protein n=1 Tax=Brassica napus TaxID=3708 RepID=A0A816S9X8_BRANA|nr:unnamed protein product [Brassica napus]